MIEQINQELQYLCRSINYCSQNYQADMLLAVAQGMAARPLGEIVEAALSHACIVGGQSVSNINELIQEFTAAATYAGDFGAYPNPTFAQSTRGRETIAAIQNRLRTHFATSDIYSFWLQEGHPFYPVFWDFAFVIELGADAYVFLGSSTD